MPVLPDTALIERATPGRSESPATHAGNPAQPHLQAFGHTGQVAASAHISKQIINQYARPDSESGAHFLRHMSGAWARSGLDRTYPPSSSSSAAS